MVVFLCSLPLDAVPLWLIDVFVGFAAAGLIAHLAESARHRPEDKPPVLLRALQSPLAARLGAFSYSLYLIHQPIQKGMLRVLQTLHLSVDQTLYFQFCVGMPLILALSYLFHRLFEVPFLARNRKSAEREPRPDASRTSRGACVSPLPDSSAG
jgi:peptidoglycan/LPS O-acetylase OafA/YrhL